MTTECTCVGKWTVIRVDCKQVRPLLSYLFIYLLTFL